MRPRQNVALHFVENRQIPSWRDALCRVRLRQNLTQTQLAAALKTSQSRVAKMEHGDTTVTLDLIRQALFQMGLKWKDGAALV